jgi:ABC-type uncharacterized transport system substrate-binding protein
VLVSGEGDLYAHRLLIAELAQRNGLAAMCPYRDYVEGGGLMAYTVDLAELLRRMADDVHQVLHGAKPGDIPIYQATKFQLLINLFNPEAGNNSRSFLRSIESAAPSLAIKKIVTPREHSADIERTIFDMGKTPYSGLVFLPDALTYARRNTIVELIARQRIPAIFPWRDFVVAGGLISYGPGVEYGDEIPKQAANYVSRILNGEKPGDLPVQAPTKLVIVMNAKAANTLGLEIATRLMALADEVIE